MKRNIVGLIAAVLIGGVVVFAIDALGHSIYQSPPNLDLTNREALARYVESLPLGALLFVALAQAAGAFSGGLVVGLISKRRTAALVYGVIALGMGLLNLVAVPHPIWLSLLLMILPIPCAMLGSLGTTIERRSAKVEELRKASGE